MSNKRILITGADGQLGKALQVAPPQGFSVIPANRQLLDIASRDAVFDFFCKHELAGVINAAAYTAVDKAETEPKLANAINTLGAENLGLAALKHNIPLVHVSTDFVFDGRKGSPYDPQDIRTPQSVYGQSKAKGEDALIAMSQLRSTIIRTAWVYNCEDSNFVTTMLRMMRERESLGVVTDQIGTPTHVTGLSSACWFFLQAEEAGVYHWTDAGVASWYDFAVSIQNIALEEGLLTKKIPVQPVRTSDYPTTAIRPHNSILDKTSCWDAMGVTPEHWQSILQSAISISKQPK